MKFALPWQMIFIPTLGALSLGGAGWGTELLEVYVTFAGGLRYPFLGVLSSRREDFGRGSESHEG